MLRRMGRISAGEYSTLPCGKHRQDDTGRGVALGDTSPRDQRMTSSPDSAPVRRQWLAPALWIALLIYSIALYLLVRAYIVLAPPYHQYTSRVYAALLLVWPVLWIAAATVGTSGRWWRKLLAALLGDRVRMTCLAGSDYVTFEGRAGDLFMQPVENR